MEGGFLEGHTGPGRTLRVAQVRAPGRRGLGWHCRPRSSPSPSPGREISAVATGLEKVSFHSNPKQRQCQRMLKLLHNCTYLTR